MVIAAAVHAYTRYQLSGRRSRIRHLNHMKVISGGCAPKPRPFYYLCHKGAAAKVRSVYSIDRPGRARPRPQHHHPVPQERTLLTTCDMTTENPQTKTTQFPHGQNAHSSFTAILPHRPRKSSPRVGGQLHLLTTTPTTSLHCLSSSPAVHQITAVV